MKRPFATPSSVLLVATRQIGDVLLTTPLLRSMRRAWPNARIDVLVYTHKGGMLEGNPDCDTVIESDEHPDGAGYRQLLKRIFRRYDLAVSTQANDRGHLYAWLAAYRRVGLVPDLGMQSLWKRAICTSWAVLDNIDTHTVVQNLVLAEHMGIPLSHEVVPPSNTAAESILDRLLPFAWRTTPYAVLHPYPMWRYKRWTDEGWRALLRHLAQRGWRVVLTGGPDAGERAQCAALAKTQAEIAINLAGAASFGTLARLLRGATAYIGPDTATTHLAAACGTPTLALYGPSNPVKWGPWPQGHTTPPSPWVMHAAPWQRVGNVLVLQGMGDCVPCRGEGCDKQKASDSRCLLEMPATRVVEALGHLLGESA
ncbi:MAG: glycosyltransferase family 9 protein [Nitrosomonadales bacterium]|nr:MAG: glycosyltransferase family 9 protein [Nitrosomonadales bacterium]